MFRLFSNVKMTSPLKMRIRYGLVAPTFIFLVPICQCIWRCAPTMCKYELIAPHLTVIKSQQMSESSGGTVLDKNINAACNNF
jgi:hypothetical protein